MISIHALREEGDKRSTAPWRLPPYFYPRPPRGGRRKDGAITGFDDFISIHALREEGDPSPRFARGGAQGFLSTPSARRATGVGKRHVGRINISIHALREEGDPSASYIPTMLSYFYPRPPRGGRRLKINPFARKSYFYPRPPRGGRRTYYCHSRAFELISIHALREEGDHAPTRGRTHGNHFYPRPPRGGRPPGRPYRPGR